MDLVETPIVAVVSNAEQMDSEDSSFDLIMCTQVWNICKIQDALLTNAIGY